MKKLFLGMAALVAMVATSCVQTEELAVANNKEAIAFDTFVENVTKGQFYTTGNLNHFNVYGTISKNGAVVTNIFPGVPVTNETGPWTYDSQFTQYWIPGFTYDFTAIVDGEVAVDATNGMPVTISTNLENQEDILYATVGPRYFGTNQTAETVNFTFAHLLSKAKFTVKNTISANQNLVYNIESVTITNADATAVYDVANHVWSASGTYPANYSVAGSIVKGEELVGNEVLLVPGTKELAIAIDYNLTYNNAVLVDETKNLTAVLTLEQGKAYNFVVEFGNPGEEIEFNVDEVLGWEYGNSNNGEVAVNGTANVATVEEFTTAFASEGIDNIVLASDIVLDGTTRSTTVYSLTVASGRTLTLDLNGHTLSGNWHKDNGAIIKNEGTLTVVGGTISSLANNGGSAILNYGTLTVERATLNGAPIVDGGWPSYAINNYGNLTVNSADIKTYHGAIATGDKGVTVINDASVDVGQSTQTKQTSWALYVFEDGQLTVNGGIFKNTKDEKNKVYGGGYICAISTKETIINGGTFEKTEADNNGTGIYYNCTNLVINGGVFDTNPTKYVAEGYKAVLSNGKYVVVSNDVEAVASTQAELESALTTGGDVVLTAGEYSFPANKIQAGTTINCAEGTIFTGTSSLNINGSTVIGATFKNDGGQAASGTIYGTFKNCTFDGEEALRWCYTEAGKTVVFENCVINNDFRGFHFDDMKGDILFKNCHINGFNAYGGEGTATFEGCTFGTDIRSRYNGLNIYANTVLTDCTFIYKSGKTNFIDMEAAGKSMTITNCTATLDGVAVDVADYVGGSKLPECTVTIDGETIVSDAASLKKAIINGGNIAFAKDITVDEWIMFSEDLNISNGTIITIDNINVSIDGKGHTLTVNTIKSGGNNDQLFQGASVLNISNLTIQYADGLTAGGLGMDSGVIKNVHFIGGGSASSSAAIFPHNGVIKVEDCIFDTNGVALYFDDECDNLSVTRCTFNQKDNKNVILLRGDVKFTDNTINSGRTVNVVSGSPVVTGNNFNNVRLKVYGAATATISNNIINNLEFDGTTYASTFSGNTLSDAAQAALNAATKVN